MSSNESNNYDLYSNESTAPLEDPDSNPPFELEATTADTLEEYDAGNGGDDDDGNNNSRIFMIALAVLAGVFIISIIGMVLLSQVIIPAQRQRQTEQAKEILYGNEQTVMAATETEEAYQVAAELTRIVDEASPTPLPTNTPTETVIVVTATPEVAAATETPAVFFVTETPESVEPTATQEFVQQTETVAALMTQVAASATATEEGDSTEPTLSPAQLTATAQFSGTSGGAGDDDPSGDAADDELPDTGLMDGGGIYVMAIAAVGLIGVIIGARKLRKAN